MDSKFSRSKQCSSRLELHPLGYLTLLALLVSLFFIHSHRIVAQNGPLNHIRDLAWSTEGTSLAMAGTIGNETGIWVLDMNTSQMNRFQTPEVLFNGLSVAWSPDGERLAAVAATTEGETAYYVWDSSTGALLVSFEQIADTDDHSIYWGSDGSELALVEEFFTVTIRDSTTGEVITKFSEIAATWDSIVALAWSLDGEYLYTASGTNVIRVWNISSAENVDEFAFSQRITSMTLSPDGSKLVIGSENGTVMVLDSVSGDLLFQLQNSNLLEVQFLQWHPSGSEILGADMRGNIAIWDANTQRSQYLQTGNSSVVVDDISYSPYGGRYAYSLHSTSNAAQVTDLIVNPADQILANGAVQIVVPDPTLERLQSIAALCNAPLTVAEAVPDAAQADQLTDFVAQIEALPAESIPPACAADLIAVAEAIQAGQ